jgi:hypothetical protein
MSLLQPFSFNKIRASEFERFECSQQNKYFLLIFQYVPNKMNSEETFPKYYNPPR